MTKSVLILGASGRFGRNAVEQFEGAGWDVHRFDRGRDDLMQSAQSADVIVNGWNPEYPDWARQLPDLHAQVIRAARSGGATVIIPGNVYVFGEQTPAPWSETTPHNARNPLGRVRIDMEAAYRRSGVRTIILRSGDFLDTGATGNWFDMIMAKSLHKGVFSYPGDPDLDHAWSYLPDLCRAAVELAEIRDSLPTFADIPFPGYTLTGTAIVQALGRVTGRPVRLRRMSWLPLQFARPFWRMAGSLLEMRYLWNTAHSLDGAALAALLPDFRVTPIDEALANAAAHIQGPERAGSAAATPVAGL